MKTTSAALTAALALAASATVAFAPASSTTAPPPEGTTHERVYFPSKDGTMLHADVLLPADGCPDEGCAPIVSIGPYFGYSTQDFLDISPSNPVIDPLNEGPSERFDDFIEYRFDDGGTIFDQGYAFVMVDSRGFGESGGCSDYGGLGEQLDAVAAVEWAGTQAWSNGKVGMWGKSYDAWTQVMALSHSPPHLEAVVIQAPIIDGYGIAWVNGVHHDLGWYITPALYNGYDYAPTTVPEALNDPRTVVHPTVGTATDPCWAEHHPYSAALYDRDLEYWRQRDLRPTASRNDDVAVLWSHGFNDINTKPDQIFGVYEPLNALPGSNHRAWFGQWAHDRGNEYRKVGRVGFLQEAKDWFDHYLKGEPFEFTANELNVVEVQDNEGAWRTEAQYPPVDTQHIDVLLHPGTYTDAGSSGGSSGYWTVSEPLEHDVRIVGEPKLSVTAEVAVPQANFIGVLYDVQPSGAATEIARTALRITASGERFDLAMHPRDHVVRPGHRLAFHVTSNHPKSMPTPTNQTVSVTELVLSLPVLTYARESNLAGLAATAQAYTQTVPASALEEAVIDFGIPAPLIPTAELRAQLQPTVTTGMDTPAAQAEWVELLADRRQ